MISQNVNLLILSTIFSLCNYSSSFTVLSQIKANNNNNNHYHHKQQAHYNLNEKINKPFISKYIPTTTTSSTSTSTSLNAIEYFDGSAIVDPVIVSDVYWNSLSTKIISVIIGQFFAAITFGIIISYASKQIQSFMDNNASNFISTLLSNSMSPSSSSSSSSSEGNNENKKSDKIIVDYQDSISSSSRNSRVIQPDYKKLLISLTIDIIGTSSELIPIVGEISDIAYAPFAAYVLRSLYGGSNIIFALEFVEEILPFTDILPLATICWFIETYYYDSDIAKLLQINNSNDAVNSGIVSNTQNSYNDGNVLDVDVESKDVTGSKSSDLDRRNIK